MNGYNLFPTISLFFVGPETWRKIFPEKTLSFERCHQEISACGRRLLKGTNRLQERVWLLQWSDQLRDLMREARDPVIMEETTVPEPRSADWCQMLALLGKLRSLDAAQNLKKEQLPHFLPCIWAPSRSGKTSSAQLTSEPTVRVHLQELHQMKTILNKMHGSQEAILEMVEIRLKAFKQALESQSGVVEVVGALHDSYLPELGVSYE